MSKEDIMSKEELKSLKANSPVARIFDFPGFLSPMLVKELRQGLRSMSFSALFITLQSILSLIILLMFTEGDGSASALISTCIFIIYTIAICGIQPLRGINAISAEVTKDTIDLVLITNLSSWKIVLGKWVSLMGQSLIFSVALLPFLILRYFMGDMMLFYELFLFGVIFILGCISTAITVGASAISTPILRFIISGGLILTLLFLTISFVIASQTANIIMEFFDYSIGMSAYLYTGLSLIIVGLYLCWIFLDFGASIIAPLSENRATIRRILYFLFLMIGTISAVLVRANSDYYEEYLVAIQVTLLIMLVPFFVTTYNENAYLSPKIILDMKKRRFLSKFRYLLYPGWATGIAFLTVCIIIHIALTALMLESTDAIHNYGLNNWRDREIKILFTFITSLIGGLVFPAAAMSIFARNVSNRLGVYLVILLSSSILTILITFLSELLGSTISMFFSWLPTVNFLRAMSYRSTDFGWLGTLNFFLLFGYLLLIIVRSKPVWQHVFQQEKNVKDRNSKSDVIKTK